MRIHHLNTGTMCPIGRRLVNGTGACSNGRAWFATAC
jgi:hypothetical protein